MQNKMFCFQCQETAGCSGCTKFGVCGKSPELANMQDLLIYVTKGLSEVTTRLRKEGKKIDKELNHFITNCIADAAAGGAVRRPFAPDPVQKRCKGVPLAACLYKCARSAVTFRAPERIIHRACGCAPAPALSPSRAP